jgi:hypothetical protein
MKKTLRTVAMTALAVMAAVLAMPGTASATTTTTVGYDVSHPQCGKTLPSARAFGIVGVNGGKATTANPCLSTQLTWAWGSSGAVAAQPKAQLYLNTANPGQYIDQVTTWPAQGSTPYGQCDGTNTTACSWQYGWERAQASVITFFTPAAQAAKVDSQPGHYTWWLDVETDNTWQSGSTSAQARNRATLEGMAAYLASRGATVGLYSTHTQWSQIVGSVGTASNLAGRKSWLPGATSLSGATTNCKQAPLTPGGKVTLAQYVPKNSFDSDKSC